MCYAHTNLLQDSLMEGSTNMVPSIHLSPLLLPPCPHPPSHSFSTAQERDCESSIHELEKPPVVAWLLARLLAIRHAAQIRTDRIGKTLSVKASGARLMHKLAMQQRLPSLLDLLRLFLCCFMISVPIFGTPCDGPCCTCAQSQACPEP
jgi:hypothetical protein